jgi:hypothetical protein
MTSRREFLWWTAAAAGGLRRSPAPRVEAVPSLLHGHPDGQATLVRFTVTGVDAPAARLRVIGPGGRLMGTAGLVRRGDLLAGQLWIPLQSALSVRSDLETPVTRGVHRTTHRLTPTVRWTIHWLTLAEPGALRRRLAAAAPSGLEAEVERLTAAGVRINPWSAPPPGGRDHLDLLRLVVPAHRLSAETGLALSGRALVPAPERADPFVTRALAAAGVAGTVQDEAAADPAALGLDAGRARMAPPVEAWLTTLSPAPGDAPSVTVVGTDPDFALRAVQTVEEWNGLYAYPRIVVGE